MIENKTKVYIAIPTGGLMRAELLLWSHQLDFNKYEITFDITTIGQAQDNRNILIKRFLKSDYEWLLFVDADTVPPPNILDMTENKVNICSGVYYVWLKNNLVPLIMKRVSSGDYNILANFVSAEHYLIEVDGIGGGALLINRKVFERLKPPYFLVIYGNDGIRVKGNDFYFCEKAKKKGFKVYVDLRFVSKHFKELDLKMLVEWMARNIEMKKIYKEGDKNDQYSNQDSS